MIKENKTLKSISLLLAAAIFFSSCSSTTLIQSVPSGAKIYIDGQVAGTTPYEYMDTKIVGSTTSIKLEKEGYQPLFTNFSRNEDADVGAIIAGCFVVIPFLWAMKYKPAHLYELETVQNNQLQPQQNLQKPAEPIQKDTKSKADRLRELKQLLDEKLITKDDYEKQKAKILESE